jgi:hypothetical protein
VNCDSQLFVDEFRTPTLVLRKDDYRQSRPLFVLGGTAAGLLASPYSLLPGTSTDDHFRFGAGLLNATVLAMAIVLAWTLLGTAGVGDVLRVAVTAVLAINDVTKEFVWVAHTQMLNIAAPVAVVGVCYLVLRRSDVEFALVGFACGPAFLASGFFAVALPAIIIARLIVLRRQTLHSLRRGAGEAIACTVAFVAPVLAWVAVVKWIVGSFYSRETAYYRQFVWMGDALKHGVGRFGDQFWSFSGDYLHTLHAEDLRPILVLPAGIAALTWFVRNRSGARAGVSVPGEREGAAHDLMIAAGLSLVGFALFSWLLGYYQNRLSFVIVPPLLVVMALQAEQLRRQRPRAVTGITCLLIASWVALHLVRGVPVG